jgi:hypothetical protein
MPRDTPALFELDQDGEASGTVHHFCSDECRFKFFWTMLPAGEVSASGETRSSVLCRLGVSNDWIDGTQCDCCGGALA